MLTNSTHYLLTSVFLLSIMLPCAQAVDEAARGQVFSFNKKSDLEPWRVYGNPLKREGIGLSSDFALNGKYSLELKVPMWKPEFPEWPIWQTKDSFDGDWTGYDRLLIDFVNPTDAVELVGIKTVDGEVAQMSKSLWGERRLRFVRVHTFGPSFL